MRAVLTALAAAHPGHEAISAAEASWPAGLPWWLAGALAVGVFTIGAVRLRSRPLGRTALPAWRVAAYVAGWLTLLVALASPLDALSDVLFAAHMTQHELLMLVAAPLFVLARPLAPLLWALPREVRLRLATRVHAPRARLFWRLATGAVAVWILHGLALWVWHVPALFEAALADERVHAVQHACFFWTAVLFWWAVVHGRYGRLGYGLAIVFVFTTGLHSGILGALLTWSQRVWYPTYAVRAPAWGLPGLEDQQLAGLIMWVPAGVVFLVVGLALFAAWLGESERRVTYTPTQSLIDAARRSGSTGGR
jgi:putative membrane protein